MNSDNTTEREAARRDPVRLRFKDLLRRNDLTLAGMLGCDPEELRHEVVPKRRPPRLPAGLPGAPLVAVPEVAVEVSAGAEPGNLRILRVRGNSMGPELRDGDRIVVDVSRRLPATGETFVLWDGIGLVVKRLEVARGDAAGDHEPARLRLISANPDYAPYSCLVQDAHILGKVLWVVSRV